MHFKRFAALISTATIAFSPALHADEMPTRKAGLWESSMTSSDGRIPATRMNQCIDDQTDKTALMGVPAGLCDLNWKRVGDRIETETKCKMGPISAEGKGVITGDFNSSVRVETTTTTRASNEGMAAGAPKLNIPAATQSMVVEAKWLGPCEPGQKPGDIIMPNGQVMQMPKLDMPKMQ